MGKTVHVLLGLLLAVVPGTAQTGAHLYSPGTNLEQSELAQLETATRCVDVAMYGFTDRYLAEELVELHRAGVRVRVYRDRSGLILCLLLHCGSLALWQPDDGAKRRPLNRAGL